MLIVFSIRHKPQSCQIFGLHETITCPSSVADRAFGAIKGNLIYLNLTCSTTVAFRRPNPPTYGSGAQHDSMPIHKVRERNDSAQRRVVNFLARKTAFPLKLRS